MSKPDFNLKSYNWPEYLRQMIARTNLDAFDQGELHLIANTLEALGNRDVPQEAREPSPDRESDYIHLDNVVYHLDDIEVGKDGKCAWTDVANALTHIKLCRERIPVQPLATEVDGCFQAAYCEGLSERLAEADQSPGTLADLIFRRLIPAHQAACVVLADEALALSRPHSRTGEA